jgi:hypothetical protein
MEILLIVTYLGLLGAHAVLNPRSSPSTTSRPLIAGSTVVGSKLSASPGMWKSALPITYFYQWQRCSAACATIDGATSPTYRVQRGDVKAEIRVLVTAANEIGSNAVPSAERGPIAPSRGSKRHRGRSAGGRPAWCHRWRSPADVSGRPCSSHRDRPRGCPIAGGLRQQAGPRWR